MFNLKNFILNTDGYKPSMFVQYPPDTKGVFSYVESRGGEYPYTLYFGLQMFIKEYLLTPITMADIDEAERYLKAYGAPFNRKGWEYIVNKHGGKLPLRVRAVREGTIVPTSNVLVTVENTDPECFWLTTYVETALLRAIWYPTTVATVSHSIKQVIKKALEQTGDIMGLPYKLHDFGARGVSSFESAGIGGAAHLINFAGSDTITGALFAINYYGAHDQVAATIPASEHSTVTSWGRDAEAEAYANMIQQYLKPGTMCACVSDSYDIYYATEFLHGGVNKQKVIDSGGILVVRPDSGDPKEVVLRCATLLDRTFGSVVNAKGYKVLNHVRIIQGDGINEQSIKDILSYLIMNGFSADNVAFGMGGALLQHSNRDTQKFAMKCSSIRKGADGDWHDVYKDPIGDKGKQSKRGRVTLYKNLKTGKYSTNIEGFDIMGMSTEVKDIMETYYENGKLLIEVTFDEIREIANRD